MSCLIRSSARALVAGLALSCAAWPGRAQDLEVAELGAPDPFLVGTLSPAPDGLGTDMWAGTSAAGAEPLVSAIAERDLSHPAALALSAGVLRTAAAGPEGGGLALTQARARALLALGYPRDAAEVLSKTLGVEDDSGAARLWVEALFWSGARDQACAVAQRAGRNFSEPFWVWVRAGCFAMNGEGRSAELAANLALSADDDQILHAQILALTGARLSAPDPDPTRALSVSLAQAGETALSADIIAALPRAGWASALGDPKLTEAARAQAAWRLARASLGDPAALTEALAGPTRLNGAEAENALKAALARRGADRAGALAALWLDGSEGVRAQALAAALDAAETVADTMAYTRLASPIIAGAPVSQATYPQAGEFAQLAALAGDADTARRWLEVAAAPPPEPAAPSADPVDGVSVGAQDDAPPPPSAEHIAFARWLTDLAEGAKGGLGERLSAELLAEDDGAPAGAIPILVLWGAAVNAEARNQLGEITLAPAGTRLPAGALLAVEAAAQAGAQAETALRVALLIDAVANPDALDVARLVAALNQVDLEAYARRIALEAVFAERP